MMIVIDILSGLAVELLKEIFGPFYKNRPYIAFGVLLAIGVTLGALFLLPNSSQHSSSPRMSDFSACLDVSDASSCSDIFPEHTKKIYLQWDYRNIPAGASYVRRWTMNGIEWVKYQCNWNGPTSGHEIVTLTEPYGLYSGAWEVTVSINGEVLLREKIHVDGNGTYWDPAGIINSCYGKVN